MSVATYMLFWVGAIGFWSLLFLLAAYFVERRAVRDGMLDADRARSTRQ